jgi:hypothetical protein
MKLTYKDIMTALYTGDAGDYMLDGHACSKPIISRENKRIIDCFFLYCFSPKDKSEEAPCEYSMFDAPFAKLAVDSISKELVYYRDNKTHPSEFEDELNSYLLGFSYSDEEIDEALPQYQKTYVLVSEFAFVDEINSEQKEILSRYMKAFEIITQTNMKRFYRELSPEFFEWAERKLS